MRGGFIISVLVILLFSGGFLYYIALAVCPAPLSYRIGSIDERFSISFDEARLSIAEAESIWEDATGKNLFTYDETAEFSVNFIFDERQALADAENDFKDRLDATENVSDAIGDTYAELVAEYNNLRDTYADRVESYERRLSIYNKKVASYNEEGGAPPNIYQELEQEKTVLDGEQRALNTLAKKLNTLVSEINRVGNQGNQLIETYNRGVDVYNETFGEQREFTQGDYQGNFINIYTFENDTELQLVLAHELGHALSLDHVTGSSSIMHYLIGGQPDTLTLSEEDLIEFNRVCGEKSLLGSLQEGVNYLFGKK